MRFLLWIAREALRKLSGELHCAGMYESYDRISRVCEELNDIENEAQHDEAWKHS